MWAQYVVRHVAVAAPPWQNFVHHNIVFYASTIYCSTKPHNTSLSPASFSQSTTVIIVAVAVVKCHYEMKQFIFFYVFHAICWFSWAFFAII